MSSCISLRLPPASKVWKSFTSTLGKLHKIRRSKAMKKHRSKHLNTITTTKGTTNRGAPKFLATRRFRRKRLATIKSVFYGFHKKPAPVYIDKLFKEPTCDLVGHLRPPQAPHKPRTLKTAKAGVKEVAGTSKGGGCDSDRASTSESDDMWESVALASPLMQGIDERAEEFIARFRQQMVAQEMRARRNL